jgi:hypothetical protein
MKFCLLKMQLKIMYLIRILWVVLCSFGIIFSPLFVFFLGRNDYCNQGRVMYAFDMCGISLIHFKKTSNFSNLGMNALPQQPYTS